MKTTTEFYYVAKQAERQFGVYYTSPLGGSRLFSMHKTLKAARIACMNANQAHKMLMAEEAAQREAAGF